MNARLRLAYSLIQQPAQQAIRTWQPWWTGATGHETRQALIRADAKQPVDGSPFAYRRAAADKRSPWGASRKRDC
jgi:hypothetical protein